MINAADFVNSKNIISLAKKNLNQKNSLISLVRIACHHNEVEKVLPLVGWLKKNGYKVGKYYADSRTIFQKYKKRSFIN